MHAFIHLSIIHSGNTQRACALCRRWGDGGAVGRWWGGGEVVGQWGDGGLWERHSLVSSIGQGALLLS